MSPLARREYVKRMQFVYRNLKGRKQKGRLLGQVSETLGCHRKHAGRLMRSRTILVERTFRRHREPVYSERVIRILESVWEATQYLWSVRLKAALPLWMSWIKKRWSLSNHEERLLLTMGPATIDRRLKRYKRKLGRKIYGRTKGASVSGLNSFICALEAQMKLFKPDTYHLIIT